MFFDKRIISAVKVFTAIAIKFVLSGCETQESGNTCSVQIEIDLTEARLSSGISDSLGLRIVSDKDNVSVAFKKGKIPNTYKVRLGGEYVRISASSPSRFVSWYGLEIEKGQECPPVWAGYCGLNTSEYNKVRLTLHKYYCRLNIRIFDRNACGVVVRGGVNGYLPDWKLSEGEFEVEKYLDGDGKCAVNIPRQRDESLTLEIRSANASPKIFNIGQSIADSGYDWKADELGDIDLEIDFSKTDAKIYCDIWNNVVEIEEKI